MKKRLLATFLVVVLLMGLAGGALAAASPAEESLPFGAELTPLSDEELAEIEGALGLTLAKAAVGAAVGGLEYLITTPVAKWSLSDGLKHTAAGAVSGLLGSFL